MTQQICIGIQQLDEVWSSILNQIGVWYEQVDYSRDLTESYSLIILNQHPKPDQTRILHSFLENKGALVEMKGIHPFLHTQYFSRKNASTLYRNTHNKIYRHIPALDVHAEAEFHKESKLYGGLIHFQVWKKGLISFFGVDLASLVKQSGYKRKRFVGDEGAHPDEIVSIVSKQELIQAFTVMLKELHFRRTLPFVQKWTSPEETPVFGFRIDTDFGDADSIDALYQLLDKHKIKGTWFLHVAAHEDWLSDFKAFQHQELALHGYSHGTSNAISKTRQNIKDGLRTLADNEITVQGYCSPYGIWNKAIERALRDFQFKYSSEFTYLYDGLPLKPASSLPLQIPIHPICTGSLSRKRYKKTQMAAYFNQVLTQKLGRYEPVFFYHHPLQTGLDVWDNLFEQVNGSNLTKLTFTEFADFWDKRAQASFEVRFINKNLSISSETTSVRYQVATNHSGFYLQQANTDVGLHKTNDFQYSNTYLPETEIVKKMHRKDLRLMKTSFLDWKNRERL